MFTSMNSLLTIFLVVLVGATAGSLGLFIVLRKLALAGDGIAHSAFTGIALGAYLGVSETYSAFFCCIIIGLLIPNLSRLLKGSDDLSIGLLFSLSMALGALFFHEAHDVHLEEITGALFGSTLSINKADLILYFIASSFSLLTILIFKSRFCALLFDEEEAMLCGVRTEIFLQLLFFILALTVVSAVRLVGAVQVSSLLIAPSALSLLFIKNFNKALLFSGIFGALFTIIGIFIADRLMIPQGATIALVATGIYFISVIAKVFVFKKI